MLLVLLVLYAVVIGSLVATADSIDSLSTVGKDTEV